MILADKIIEQRKKCGWSQEELADKMNVSRQSVSKWEGAQSAPDLEKILQLARIFGVSTDYLLKDEIEDVEYVEDQDWEEPPRKKVTLQEANNFLQVKEATAKWIAIATFICILSPVALLFLGAASEDSAFGISENMAGGIGITTMLLMVTVAVAMYIYTGSKTSPYQYLENQVFETEYGVTGMVRERQNQYRGTYTLCNILGTCLCIIAVLPLLASAFITERDIVICGALCIGFVIAGVGVMLFIVGGIKWSSYQKLLQEGDYTKRKKKKSPMIEAFNTAYWLIAVAIYLAWSFTTNEWHRTWILWPVVGVLYAAIFCIFEAVDRKNR